MGEDPERQTDAEEPGQTFLLADFGFMANYTQESIRLADKRVDVLLTLSIAVYGGIVALSSQTVNRLAPLGLALVSSMGLGVIGWFTFKSLLEQNILLCEYARALNRIRAFFATRYPFIKQYILMPTSFRHPRYDWRSSGEVIVEVVNCLSAGVFAASSVAFLCLLGFTTYDLDSRSLYWAVPAFLLSSVLAWSLQIQYARKLFDFAEKDASDLRSSDDVLFASHEKLSLHSAHQRAARALGAVEGPNHSNDDLEVDTRTPT